MRHRLSAFFLGVMASAGAFADDLGFHVNAGIGHSDNIGRVAENEQSETIGSTGLDFAVLKQTRRLDVDATADLAWLNYFDNTFDNEVVGNLEGEARYAMVPERLHWTVQDNFGQGRVDPLAAATPDNRENINYFTTGPDLTIGLSSATRARLSGRYSKVSYEENPLDNERITGALGLIRSLSNAESVALTAQRESLDFADPASQDYDRDQIYLSYDASGHRTRLAVDVGYVRLNRFDDASADLTAFLELSRMLSVSSALVFSGGRGSSDAATGFRLSQSLGRPGMEAQSVLQTSEPFTSTHGSLAWRFNRNRTGLGLSVSYFDENYSVSSIQDRTRWVAGASASRNFTTVTRALLTATYAKDDFEQIAGDFRETVMSAGVTRDIGPKLSLTLEAQRYSRSSELALTEYTENRGWLSLTYGREARLGNTLPPLPAADTRL